MDVREERAGVKRVVKTTRASQSGRPEYELVSHKSHTNLIIIGEARTGALTLMFCAVQAF